MISSAKDNTNPVKTMITIIFCLMVVPVNLYAQDMTQSLLDRFSYHFDQSVNKLTQLAEAMPEETYNWSPDGEAMTVAEVFMHIARYNYILAERWLDVDVPEGAEPAVLEEIEDKETVVRELEKSIRHVQQFRDELTREQLHHSVEIFGETTEGWAVLFLLISHMNEHVGQAISYARMNGVVPPWSR
jgi:uncharacterized damage-inducible protein DinB